MNISGYNISKTVSYIVLSFVGVILILLVGFFTQGVRLDFLQICIFFGYLMIGSIVFIALALLISLLGSAAQPLGTLLYLMLSFIGGLWMPIDAMPVFLQHIAKFTPSYNYAKVMWNMIGHQSFPVQSIVILIVWFLIFIIIYVFLTKKTSICKK